MIQLSDTSAPYANPSARISATRSGGVIRRYWSSMEDLSTEPFYKRHQSATAAGFSKRALTVLLGKFGVRVIACPAAAHLKELHRGRDP